MKISEIGFTVYPVSGLAKARPFYEGTLGLTPTMVYEGDGLGWVEYDIASGTLAICAGGEFQPSKNGGCVGLEVADFDASVALLREKEVPFTMGPMETSVCFLVGFTDPDGNSLMLHHRKPQ